MQAYVINLARSADRRAHVLAQLKGTSVPYELVEAVDGRELDLRDTALIDPVAVGSGSFRLGAGGPGAAGCSLSHLKVYRKVIEAGHERALVLEDDVLLPPDLAELAEEVGREMSGADVVLLSFDSPGPCRVDRRSAVALSASRRLVQPVDLSQPRSTGAYIITREACRGMEKLVLPVRVAADDWEFFCRHGAIERLRCVTPRPVRATTAFRSTIDYHDPGTFQARVREFIDAHRLPVLSQLLAYRRQRIFRRLGWTGDIEFVEAAAD